MHIKVGSDLAYQMRFGLTSSGHQTAGSPPTSHQTQLGEIYSGQKKKKCWKNQHQPCHASRFEHRDQERGAGAAAERIFQKPPIIWCVGEHNELGRMPNSILYQTNRNFWQDVSAFQRTAHAGAATNFSYPAARWFLNLTNNIQDFNFILKTRDKTRY